ncbi:2-oxoacid dehydrogenases acyltransferase-domain-containing protein [Phakopsora pachyrhizi]|nr:2-oxoacid dehydrogenases acyltransferase-domain-containing protein [Phakopsora pachyrhizi]
MVLPLRLLPQRATYLIKKQQSSGLRNFQRLPRSGNISSIISTHQPIVSTSRTIVRSHRPDHHNQHCQSHQRKYSDDGRTKATVRTSDGKLLKPFLLADIGEGITGCEIVEWLVKPGQKVSEFDPIAEVQSDKATVQITSPFDGMVERILGKVGEVIKVGEPLCMIIVEADEGDNSLNELKKNKEQQEKAQASDEEIASGNDREMRENCRDRSDRTITLEPDDPLTGRLIHSTPAVRRLAKEHQIQLRNVTGTGKDGRITKEDVLNFMESVQDKSILSPTVGTTATTEIETIQFSSVAQTKKVSLGPVRLAMFRAMSQTLKIPHFGYYEEIDVTELEKLRKNLSNSNSSSRIDEPRIRITLLALFVKIMAVSMRENEIFRSTLSTVSTTTDQSPFFVQRESCDISIAVSSRVGLLTPLIPCVESKSIVQIAEHILRLREFIEGWEFEDKIPKIPEELGGNRSGTITLSNIGIIGGTYTHPLIPPTGQLAIAGIGSMAIKPGYRPEDMELAKRIALKGGHETEGNEHQLKISPRLKINFSFTADHRVVEGTELARLVLRFKELCERPEKLIEKMV